MLTLLERPVTKRCERCGHCAPLSEDECVSCGAELPSLGLSALDLQRMVNRDASRRLDGV